MNHKGAGTLSYNQLAIEKIDCHGIMNKISVRWSYNVLVPLNGKILPCLCNGHSTKLVTNVMGTIPKRLK